jgi:putative chitinase
MYAWLQGAAAGLRAWLRQSVEREEVDNLDNLDNLPLEDLAESPAPRVPQPAPQAPQPATQQELQAAADRLRQALKLFKAEEWHEHLLPAMLFYEINTPRREAAFLAQLAHESGRFRYVREIWGPTPAQQRYEGRADLGNTEPGDGSRYRGRGLIQTTGRQNYRLLTQRLRKHQPHAPDFEADPAALEEPQWAAWSAADFWDRRRLNVLADSDDFTSLTRRINGGVNGLAERRRYWLQLLQFFED